MDASPFEKDERVRERVRERERGREDPLFLGIFPGKKSANGS
jgi:hypothetical protein